MTKTTKAKTETTPRKRAAADDPAQYERFRGFAREHEADESKEKFDKTFEAIITKPRQP
jgi:hypothetical protein